MKTSLLLSLLAVFTLHSCFSSSENSSSTTNKSSSSGTTSGSSSSGGGGGGGTSTSPLAVSPDNGTISSGETMYIIASGGTSPYTYAVKSGSGTIGASTGLFVAPNSAGTSVISVTDAAGSVVTTNITTTASTLTLSPATYSMAAGGSITFTASGGSSPYTYTKVSGGGSVTSSGTYTAGSSAGTAVIQVTDSAGNSKTSNITIKTSGSTDVAMGTVTVHASKYLGISWEAIKSSSNHPALLLYGMGSSLNASSIADSASFCILNGVVQGACGLRLELHNLKKSDTSNYVYKAKVNVNSGSNKYSFGLCIEPSNKGKAYIDYIGVTTRTISTIRFNYPKRIYMNGAQLRSDYLVVHNGSGVGHVTVTLSDGAYTTDTTCGTGYSTAYYLQANN